MHITNTCLDVPIQSVMTDNGRFERVLSELSIKHRLTKVRHPWTNGACERLNRTLLEDFYQVAFRSKLYHSSNELNTYLLQFIEFYNCQRTHYGKRTKGNVPAWLFLLHQVA